MKYTRFYILISLFLFGSFYIFAERGNSKYRLIHNNDGSDILGNRWFGQRLLTVDDVNKYVDLVANSQVTTYMICSGSDFLYYRSKFGRVFGDDLNGTLNCGNDTVTYKNFKKNYANHLNLERQGTDLIRATLTRAKEKGMEAVITYRMNDLHFADTTTHCPIYYSTFWMNHPEYWLKDTTQGWNSGGALNFAIKEVRDHKLSIISEQLDKYEMIDGFDLDFMRFIVYFLPGTGEENAPLITQLVKDIRGKMDEVSAKRGKKLTLSVRVPPTLDACIKKGLDVREWIRLGLIDYVSIGVHWLGDPSMPVAEFKKELGYTTIPVYASVDDGGYKPRETYSHGMLRGMASYALSQGADGLYLFNFYFSEYLLGNKDLQLSPGGKVSRIREPSLLQEIGKQETLESRNKIYSLSDGTQQYGIKPVTPLPLIVTMKKSSVAPIYIGDNISVNKPLEVILFIRTNKGIPFRIMVNGVEIRKEVQEYTALYDRNRGLLSEEKEYAFIVPLSSIKKGYNDIEFKSITDSFKVKRVELALNYGDEKTHGYF